MRGCWAQYGTRWTSGGLAQIEPLEAGKGGGVLEQQLWSQPSASDARLLREDAAALARFEGLELVTPAG